MVHGCVSTAQLLVKRERRQRNSGRKRHCRRRDQIQQSPLGQECEVPIHQQWVGKSPENLPQRQRSRTQEVALFWELLESPTKILQLPPKIRTYNIHAEKDWSPRRKPLARKEIHPQFDELEPHETWSYNGTRTRKANVRSSHRAKGQNREEVSSLMPSSLIWRNNDH